MKVKVLLLFSAILMSLSLQAQNSIAIISPQPSVEANTHVDITFDYTLAEVGHAFIRFKNADGNVTASPVYDLAAGSGTLTVSLEIPRSFNGEVLPLDNSYSFQAQLFNSGYSETLASVDYNGVTLTAAANYIELTNYPTTVNADSFVDITFDYASDMAAPLYAFIRIHDASGTQLSDTGSITLNTASGTAIHSVEIEVPEGTDYEYRILLFHPSNWGAAIASFSVPGITVEEAIAPANSITISDPETTVFAGRMIDYDLSYVTDEPAAYALIRFKGPSGNLEQAFQEVAESEGTVTVSVLSPETAGTNYSLQAQLYTKGWAELDTYDLAGITVEEYIPTGENTLEIVNTSTDPINNGTLRQVDVKYNLLQTSKILVEVRDKEDPASGKKIGDVWIELPAGNDTVTLDLVVDAGFPGATNRIQALLFEGGTSWDPISIPEIPYLLVGEGDGTITYRGQPFVGDGTQNNLFSEDLGNGYYTNYYIANGWEGPLKMKFGAFGTPSWIEFENQNTYAQGHREFDIKIQKFSWHEDKDFFTDRGYPTALKDIDFPLECTLEGQWSAGSGGKGQVNMTAWVTETGDMSGNRIDVIVHAFDNGGNSRVKYDNEEGRFRNIGEFTANNGLTYQILRTLPGSLGEVASYNLVPDAIVQEDPRADYTTDVITSTIDMKNIMDNLIAKEAAYTGSQGQVAINNDWLINGLEWTVVGQSENLDSEGIMIPSGHGRFTFNDYTIPDLVETLSTDDFDSKLKNLSIYPNPFSDSFNYKLDAQLSEPLSVDVFSIDGRKINTNTTSYGNSGTVYTGKLSKGMYLVRITAGNVQETRRLIKN
ncbi:T9SS type A sorting domain-containing protein [Algibacter sp. AS12]|uniref:T9SS type A sorting domain-containing protein n=1 Tax=Algibacter sp. AS12 TaxID=3135773 RepID=UPI00398A8716